MKEIKILHMSLVQDNCPNRQIHLSYNVHVNLPLVTLLWQQQIPIILYMKKQLGAGCSQLEHMDFSGKLVCF
jgi:hypothetical protein